MTLFFGRFEKELGVQILRLPLASLEIESIRHKEELVDIEIPNPLLRWPVARQQLQ